MTHRYFVISFIALRSNIVTRWCHLKSLSSHFKRRINVLLILTNWTICPHRHPSQIYPSGRIVNNRKYIRVDDPIELVVAKKSRVISRSHPVRSIPPKLLLVVISKVHSDNSGTSTRPRLANLRIWFFFLRGAAGRISIRQQLCEFSRCECRLPPGLDRTGAAVVSTALRARS